MHMGQEIFPTQERRCLSMFGDNEEVASGGKWEVQKRKKTVCME